MESSAAARASSTFVLVDIHDSIAFENAVAIVASPVHVSKEKIRVIRDIEQKNIISHLHFGPEHFRKLNIGMGLVEVSAV